MKVLVVDDCKMSQKISKYLLEIHGHRVSIASNGLEALESLEMSIPDLILMDIEMPVMDGLEATKRIRANERLKNTPIIAVTSHRGFEDHEGLSGLGLNGHIAKPVNFERFYEVVSRYLGQEDSQEQ